MTGGAGFIGSHLADALLARGESLVLLDDFSTGRRETIEHLLGNPQLELIEGSALDQTLVDELVASTDATLHLASAVGVQLIVSSPLSSLLGNVRGTDNVFASAVRHGKRLLFTSTSEVYGKNSAGPLSEDADRILGSAFKSRWAYAMAKGFGEALAHGYYRDCRAEVIVARLFNTVGPRQTAAYGMVLPRFVRQALAGEELTVYGDGMQTRCFTHVADTVDALLLLLDYGLPHLLRRDAGGRADRCVRRRGPDARFHVRRRCRVGDESGGRRSRSRRPDLQCGRRIPCQPEPRPRPARGTGGPTVCCPPHDRS